MKCIAGMQGIFNEINEHRPFSRISHLWFLPFCQIDKGANLGIEINYRKIDNSEMAKITC